MSDEITPHTESYGQKESTVTTIVRPGLATCVRCEQEFAIGIREACPRACDGGEHESTTIHFFKPGRFDGLCAEPTAHGLMCGYPHGEAQVHTEIPPEVKILR